MKATWHKFILAMCPARHVEDEEVRHLAEYNTIFALIQLVGFIIYYFIFSKYVTNMSIHANYLYAAALITLAMIIFKLTGSFCIAFNYQVFVIVSAITFNIFITGGIASPNIIWYIPVMVGLGRFLQTTIEKILWMLIICLILAVFLLLYSLGYDLPNVVLPLAGKAFVIHNLLFCTFITIPVVILIEDSINSIERHNKETENKVRMLLRAILHDTSNPLLVIRGACEIAQENTSNVEQCAQMLRRIDVATANICDIFDKIKNIEQIKSGKIVIQVSSVALITIIDESLTSLGPRLKEKNISITFSRSDFESAIVLADAVTLNHEVVSNLIGNAIKFSDADGAIELKLAAGHTFYCLSIIDNGTGISRDQLQKFRTIGAISSTTGTAGEKGTGFGLTIVKSFVELFGGRVEVDSKHIDEYPVDHGTEFKVYLKRAV